MKIFLICSKQFYNKIPEIKDKLEKLGHLVSLPNCYDDPTTEDRYRKMSTKEHADWKATMLRHSSEVIGSHDAVLVLNFEKNGIKNYIGGATFLEMYDAFRLGKKIFIYNGIPEGMLADEINGFSPVLINTDLTKISQNSLFE